MAPSIAEHAARFSDLHLPQLYVANLKNHCGMQLATLSQLALFRALHDQKDVFLRCRTGTGKTFGLVLAILAFVHHNSPSVSKAASSAKKQRTSCLMIVPTLPLVQQVINWASIITGHPVGSPALAELIQGTLDHPVHQIHGQSQGKSNSLRGKPAIVVGTPARLLLNEEGFDLSDLGLVVLDEADTLLDIPTPATAAAASGSSNPEKAYQDACYRWRSRPNKFVRLFRQLNEECWLDSRPQVLAASATLNRSTRNWLLMTGAMGARAEKIFDAEQAPSLQKVEHVVVDVSAVAKLIPSEKRSSTIDASRDASNHDASSTDASSTDVCDARSTNATIDDASTIDTNNAASNEAVEYASKTFRNVMSVIAELAGNRHSNELGILFLSPKASSQTVLRSLQRDHSLLETAYLHSALGLDKDDLQQAKDNQFTNDAQSKNNMANQLISERRGLLLSSEAETFGLDIAGLSYVIIVGMPDGIKPYLHMSGRLGRLSPEALNSKLLGNIKDKHSKVNSSAPRNTGVSPGVSAAVSPDVSHKVSPNAPSGSSSVSSTEKPKRPSAVKVYTLVENKRQAQECLQLFQENQISNTKIMDTERLAKQRLSYLEASYAKELAEAKSKSSHGSTETSDSQ